MCCGMMCKEITMLHFLQGYANEMDNEYMFNLIPDALKGKKDILFGNMPQIYEFHSK